MEVALLVVFKEAQAELGILDEHQATVAGQASDQSLLVDGGACKSELMQPSPHLVVLQV